jgi:hypothetical protein
MSLDRILRRPALTAVAAWVGTDRFPLAGWKYLPPSAENCFQSRRFRGTAGKALRLLFYVQGYPAQRPTTISKSATLSGYEEVPADARANVDKADFVGWRSEPRP